MKIGLFGGNHYYPDGGLRDFIGFYDSVELAIKAGQIPENDWYQVVDVTEMEELDSGSIKYCRHKECESYKKVYWHLKCLTCGKSRFD